MSVGRLARLALIVTVSSAVYGMAATLNMQVVGLGAFALDAASCQRSQFTTSWSVDGDYVDTVEVSNIDPACIGATLKVRLVDSSGGALGSEQSITITDAVEELSFRDQDILDADADKVHAVVPRSP